MFAPILMSSGGSIQLQAVDYLILAVYFAFVIGIGFALQRHTRTSDEFFLSGRSMPGWVTGLAFISANLGAQELIGMAASGAQYGIMTAHFYWVGAIPAMVFLGVFMMPMYYGSKARSVPEYLKLRFDERTRAFNSYSFAVMTISSSGISMHVLADLINRLIGWDYTLCLVVTSVIILLYVLKGGLTSAMYTEVLQFFMIVFGIAPLAWIALRDIGGWDGLVAKLTATKPDALHSWAGTAGTENAMGVEWYGILIGLGFVLSFGYWCTNFAEVQRAMVAKDMGAARRTPIIGAIPKMLFPAVVILPGLVAFALTGDGQGYELPTKDGVPNYNQVLPSMLLHYFPSGMLGLALTALMASFMSGTAANVTAFNTVWTYDIYQSTIGRGKDDAHLLRMGKYATVFGILASMAFAFVAAQYNNILSILQLIFGFVNAPLFATFLLGMFTRRSSSRGAFTGLIIGTFAALLYHGFSHAAENPLGMKGGWLAQLLGQPAAFTLGTELAQTFWLATVAFSATFLVNLIVSLVTGRDKTDAELSGLVYSLTPKPIETHEHFLLRPAVLGSLVLAVAIFLNLYFW
jgi:SSS family solute:Na+ symporter